MTWRGLGRCTRRIGQAAAFTEGPTMFDGTEDAPPIRGPPPAMRQPLRVRPTTCTLSVLLAYALSIRS